MSITVYSGDTFQLAHDRLTEVATSLQRLGNDCDAATWYPALADDVLAKPLIWAASLEGALLADLIWFAAASAAVLGDHLEQAQRWYEGADDAVRQVMVATSDAVYATVAQAIGTAAQLGAGAALALLSSPAGLAGVTVVALGGAALVGTGAIDGEDVARLGEHAGATVMNHLGPLLSNPQTVLLLRGLVSASDDIINQAGGYPFALAASAVGAPLMMFLSRGGVRDSRDLAGRAYRAIDGGKPNEFTVRQRESESRLAPTSVREVVDHIPPSVDGEPQVRITEYRTATGERAFHVSVAGTSSPALGGENVLDNLSNLDAYAGIGNESIAAVEEAMREAGITSHDAVMVSGYSQGAMITTHLAASGEWNVTSVVLAGSPTHGNAVPDEIPVVQLEHSNDPITALQGHVQAPRGDVAVVVRNTHPQGVPPGGEPLAGHALNEYRATASEYDGLDSEHDAAHRAQTLAPLAGAEAVRTTDYIITRGAQAKPWLS